MRKGDAAELELGVPTGTSPVVSGKGEAA